MDVDSVSYAIPAAVLKTGIWSGPGPNGTPKPRFDNDFLLYFSAKGERDYAVNILSSDSAVLSVSGAGGVIAHQTTPDDSLFPDQWGLENTTTPTYDIGATYAWDYTTGDPNMIVAVIDRGVAGQHPDFVSGGSSKVIGDVGVETAHGTRIAGVIGAYANNGPMGNGGIVGVDWQARIYATKIHGPNDSTWPGPPNIAEKFIEAVDGGARISNHSYGENEFEIVYARAHAYAYNEDVVSIASSGNKDLNEKNHPAALPTTIAVGAINIAGTRWTNSTYGDHLDLVAPGVSIRFDI